MQTVTSKGTAQVTLPADDQILITRELAAPRHLVYEAWTTPELVRKWWGAEMGEVTHTEIDLRVGGTWRFVSVANEGFEVAFHGEYKEIVPNERIVSTEAYEGVPDPDANATTNTVTFEEAGGGTRVTILVQCPSAEVRDAIIESGMEVGMQKSLDALERVALALALA
jgi:uncharacterized protein YndB with AHSA1/START domain